MLILKTIFEFLLFGKEHPAKMWIWIVLLFCKRSQKFWQVAYLANYYKTHIQPQVFFYQHNCFYELLCSTLIILGILAYREEGKWVIPPLPPWACYMFISNTGEISPLFINHTQIAFWTLLYIAVYTILYFHYSTDSNQARLFILSESEVRDLSS